MRLDRMTDDTGLFIYSFSFVVVDVAVVVVVVHTTAPPTNAIIIIICSNVCSCTLYVADDGPNFNFRIVSVSCAEQYEAFVVSAVGFVARLMLFSVVRNVH